MKGPLCRWCGKPVPRRLTYHTWNRTADAPTEQEFRDARNDHVISVRRFEHLASDPAYADVWQRLCSAHTWDGESYVWGGHFHAQSCAAAFGLWLDGRFPDNYATKDYLAAVAAREAKK